MRNLIWNLIFILDLGGLIALSLAAWMRWPGLARLVDVSLCLAGPVLAVALALGFVRARAVEYKWRNN